MNEKEIIEILKRDMFMFSCEQQDAIQDFLDLYNKEKEKNNQKYYHTIECRELEKEVNKVWENKIREKIKELPIWLTEEEKRGIKFFVKELLEEK